MIHAQEGTRGLLQKKLLKQEECSSSAGDGLDETHTNDKVVTEKDASRDARKRRFFTRSALPNCKAGTCLFCMKHGYKRQNRKEKSEPGPLTPECQTCQASEDTASSSLEEG